MAGFRETLLACSGLQPGGKRMGSAFSPEASGWDRPSARREAVVICLGPEPMTAMAESLLAPLHEFLFLERAARAAEAFSPDQRSRVLELRAAATERLVAARRASSTLAACMLSREAVALFARARALARNSTLDEAALARLDGCAEVPDLGPDPTDGTTGDAILVREALATSDLLYLERLDQDVLDRLRIALDRAARELLGRVETRSPAHIRALRWGRFSALFLVALYAAWLVVRPLFVPVNISAGKPVRASSHHPLSPTGRELVDGHPGIAYGVHTAVEDVPFAEIDLLVPYAVDHVDVYNRSDGWQDECLPLVLELSMDGKAYTEIGRRDQHFGADVPWSVPGSNHVARFVRLRVAKHSFLALGLVDVFGTKRKP